MKRFLIFVLSVFVCLLVAGCAKDAAEDVAEDAADEAGITWSFDETTKTLTVSGKGDMWDAVEPLPTSPSPWGEYNSMIETIVIEKGVTNIGYQAFRGCDSLTKVIIPDGVTIIGGEAFSNCNSLTEITIPDSVTVISYHAFEYCENLTEITIPEGVIGIGELAFFFCDNLKKITIPSSVTIIGDGAFAFCRNLAEFEVAEDNEYFCDVDGVLFDKNVKTLISYPSGNLDSPYSIPTGVTSIGNMAFWGCPMFKTIIIPNSVTSIDSGAFNYENDLFLQYDGTKEQWEDVEIIGDGNNPPRRPLVRYNK